MKFNRFFSLAGIILLISVMATCAPAQPLPDRITPEFERNIKEYQKFMPFYHGLARVEKDGKWGYMNTTGKLVIPAIYDEANDFSNKDLITSVKKNGKWGYINLKGETIVPFQFDDIAEFSKEVGLAAASQNGKWGFINEKGETVLPFVWDGIGRGFKDGKAIVKKNGKEGIIDTTGELITALIPETIYDYKEPGFIIIGYYGVVGKNGNLLVPSKGSYMEDGMPIFQFYKGKLIHPDHYSWDGPLRNENSDLHTLIDCYGNVTKEKVNWEDGDSEETNNFEDSDDTSDDDKYGEYNEEIGISIYKLGNDIYAYMGDNYNEIGFIDKNGIQLLPAIFSVPLGEYDGQLADEYPFKQGNMVWVYLNFETDAEWKDNKDFLPMYVPSKNIKVGYVDKYGNTTFTQAEMEKAGEAAKLRNEARYKMYNY